jgi:hypothetical protein
MPWEFEQSTGRLKRDGRVVATGYSGAGGPGSAYRNNPRHEGVKDKGTIPAGRYRIGRPRTSEKTGPHVLDLSPVGHNAHGRTAFQIHGNNKANNASNGCIILPPGVRKQISWSGDAELVVVAGE